MRNFYLMVGPPGCGKSTYIDQVLRKELMEGEEFPAYFISRDRIIDDISIVTGLTYSEIWQANSGKLIDKAFENVIKEQLASAEKYDCHVIWDQTNLTKKSRARTLSKLKFPMTKIAVNFEPMTLEEVKPRLDSRPGKIITDELYLDMAGRYEEPTLDEGFDFVMQVSPHFLLS